MLFLFSAFWPKATRSNNPPSAQSPFLGVVQPFTLERTEVPNDESGTDNNAVSVEWLRTGVGDAEEYRLHCTGHIRATVAAALALHKIHLPAETWAGVLPSCGLQSLGERVSLTRRQFHAIARPLIDGPKGRVLPKMAFLAENDNNRLTLMRHSENGGVGVNRLVEVPVAEVPPPQSVVGFSQIVLRRFNAKVLSFLGTIRHLPSDVRLVIDYYSHCLVDWSAADRQRQYKWNCCRSNPHSLAALQCLLRVFPRLGRSITALCLFNSTIGVELLAARLLTTNSSVRHLCIYSPPPAPQSLFITESNLHTASVQLPFRTLHNERTGEMLTMHHFVLDRGSIAQNYVWSREMLLIHRRASTTPTDQDGSAAEMDAVQETFLRALFSYESRNELVLNINEIDEIDESLYPADSGDEQPLDGEADANVPGPSSAK